MFFQGIEKTDGAYLEAPMIIRSENIDSYEFSIKESIFDFNFGRYLEKGSIDRK